MTQTDRETTSYLSVVPGLGLDMSISQESTTTLEEEGSAGKWKTEAAGNSKHEQSASEDRLLLTRLSSVIMI